MQAQGPSAAPQRHLGKTSARRRLMGDVKHTGTAEITMNAPDASGLSLHADGSYELGIGRVGFLLVDLAKDLAESVVCSKIVDYSGPLPQRVSEEWTTVALTAGTAYRAFFHVYDRTGVNLVAYDRRDFTCG